MRWCTLAIVVVAIAMLVPYLTPAPQLQPDLKGQIAVVTGGSRGAGRGIAMGLGEAGATVYITGRTQASLDEACSIIPGKCIGKVMDNANDTSMESFFKDLKAETGGRLDILVNNAYSAVGYWNKNKLLGKAFWDTPMQLFDEVFNVGVRSHYKATQLAMGLMAPLKKGLIINVNSMGCVSYTFNVPYGMGKCSVDKMTADFAIEAATEGVDIVTLSPGILQTEEVYNGALDGTSPRRGAMPGMPQLSQPDLNELLSTPMGETLLFSGRAVAHFARDSARSAHSGKVLIPAILSKYYGFTDERGIMSPFIFSVKGMLFMLVPPLKKWAGLADVTPFKEPPSASANQVLLFNKLPDLKIPMVLLKAMSGFQLF